LSIKLPRGVPTIEEQTSPPRFVVDVPVVLDVAEGVTPYKDGLVAQVVVSKPGGSRTRIVVELRRPLNGGWQVSYIGGRLELTFVPIGPARAATPTPRARRSSRR
jgi:hypothetical protein